MPYDSDFCDSPMKPPASPPAGYKGGPGVYNGEEGYPKRTSDSNAAPEIVRDGGMPTTQDTDFPASGTPVGTKG
jgi:hypothetical protein